MAATAAHKESSIEPFCQEQTGRRAAHVRHNDVARAAHFYVISRVLRTTDGTGRARQRFAKGKLVGLV